MKTAIFINEGRTQVVLTPENEWETSALKMIEKDKKDLNVYFSQFNNVQGGWTMFEDQGHRGEDKDSLIIVLDKELKVKLSK